MLAGGLGTRLRAEVPDVPKPMAPVGGRPFLEILLRKLSAGGIDRVVLSVGYRAESITDYFGRSFAGLKLEYAIEAKPLGTGGATRLALEFCDEDAVLVTNGDTFLDLDLAALQSALSSRDAAVLVAREVPDTSRYGRLIVQDDLIVGFVEKGVTGRGLVNAGTYYLRRDLLASIPSGTPFSLENEVLVPAVASRAVRAFVSEGTFIDIGIPEDYRRAQTLLAHFATGS